MANPISFVLMTQAQWEEATALDVPNSGIMFGGRQIDNPLANNIGSGTLVGGATTYYVINVHVLVDPDYAIYYDVCSGLPIITVDPEVLFLPVGE